MRGGAVCVYPILISKHLLVTYIRAWALFLPPSPAPCNYKSLIDSVIKSACQMQYYARFISERDVDCCFANERRSGGSLNAVLAYKIHNMVVGDGGVGNVERCNGLREFATQKWHCESFSKEAAMEVVGVSGERASGGGHDGGTYGS